MKVIVVEDDADLRTLVWRIFADAGHEVAMAADGAEGIEKLHALRPELLVLDLTLPGIDGWGVLRSVRRLPVPPRVVVLSPQTEGDAYERAWAEGVIAYVEKPFLLEDLLATCEKAGPADGSVAVRDRRRSPRRVLRVSAQVLTREQGWWTEGELMDIGSSGARIAMAYPLPAVESVRLAFAVPGDGRVSVEGRLQWRAPAERGFAYGLSFVGVLPEAQRQIDAIVEASI